jgi:hypothetical protein
MERNYEEEQVQKIRFILQNPMAVEYITTSLNICPEIITSNLE